MVFVFKGICYYFATMKKKKKSGTLEPPPTLKHSGQLPVYRSIKFMLKKLVRPEDAVKIEGVVNKCHSAATLALELVKLYSEFLYVQNQDLPILDDDFYSTALLVVTKKKVSSGPPSKSDLYKKLLKFHTEHFLPLSPEGNKRIEVQNMSHIFSYMAQDMATTQLTNITRNFPNYVKRFVNTYFRDELYCKNGWHSDYKMTKEESSVFYRELKHVKEDILFCRRWTSGYKSIPKYHDFLERCVDTLFPTPLNPTHKWGLYQDVREQPYVYLSYMMDINIELESRGNKLFSPFCLRTSLSPRYIKLDTASIVDLLYTKQDINDLRTILDLPNLKKKNDLNGKLSSLLKRDVSKAESFKFKTVLWKHIFKFGTNKYTRHLLESNQGTYVFDNSILTDGVGVSVLQLRSDRVGHSCKANGSKSLQVVDDDVPYLNEISQSEKDEILSNDILIGGDPGKDDIIFLINQDGVKLRYTQQQRAVECRFKKNKKAMIKMKKNTICSNGKTVEKVEQEINYNSKSCLLQSTMYYIEQRRKLEALVYPVLYNRQTIRKLRFSAKSHTMQSEDRLINRIVDTYHQPQKDAITIAWGNWSQPQSMKNLVSTPGVGLRKTLVRKGRIHNIKIARENESYTSCTCNNCHANTAYCKKRSFIKNGKNQTRWIHSLLRCQNESCGRRWNRNVLGATNILEVALATLQGLERPAHFKSRTCSEDAGEEASV